MSGKGIGFGKTILFGEHFVVYGLPGIASAISDLTTAEVEEGEKFELVDNRPAVEGYKVKKQEEISRELDSIFEFMKIDREKPPLKITLAGNLECASGIGASAALASSIARALSEHLSLNLTDDQINEIAFEGERGGSGTPSGIDNTCSTYGGMITFEKNLSGGPNKIEHIEVGKPFEIVMVNTGITQETKKVVADVRAEKEKDPEKYEKIFSDYKKTVDEAVVSLKEGNIENVGKLMDKNQELLRQITVSCPEVENIVKMTKEKGALGAKLTGTGRGGLVICLSPGKDVTKTIVESAKAENLKVNVTTLGKK